MSKRRKKINREKNPFQMVLYIIAVAALLVCIVFIYRQNKQKQAAYTDRVEELAAVETEMKLTEREPRETETEEVTDTKPETESENGLQAELADSSILVLNGTRRPGVAGIWKTRLEEAGYQKVYTASYGQDAGAETVIHTENEALGEALLEQFPEATVEEGTVESGIEPEEGETLPQELDAYLVIGKNDVVSE